jgi:sugar phosphate isomerase/epimerase
MSLNDASFQKDFKSKFSLGHLTLLGCSIPELIYIASRTGYDAVSPRLITTGTGGEFSYSPLGNEIIQATYNAIEVTGITVNDIELASISKNHDVKSYEPVIELGAKLGAKNLISSAWTTKQDDRNFIIDQFSSICEISQTYELSVALEFPTFSRLVNLKDAVDIVEAANQVNGGILIDTLYMHMSRVDSTELEGLPPEWFKFIQVSDVAPGIPDYHEGIIDIARSARLYPGEGCIDFIDIIEKLPPVDYCIELPNKNRVAELGYEEHARRCIQAAKKSFGNITNKLTIS